MMLKREHRIVLTVILSCIFIVGGVYIIKYYVDGHRANSDFDNMRDIVDDVERDGDGNIIEQYAENGMILSYYELWSRNNDMVGWVKIGDTQIDYPVMYKSEDWMYYMKRNFDGESQSRGTPFVDIDCDVFKPSTNIIIYGHNMRDKSMFGALHYYKDKSFWETHSDIYFDTLYKRGTYKIFAVLETTANDTDGAFKYNQNTELATEEDFNNFVTTAKYLSFYDTGITPQFGDELLTLSTCAYDVSNGRIIVIAKKVS